MKSIIDLIKKNKIAIILSIIAAIIYDISKNIIEIIPYAGKNVIILLRNLVYYRASSVSTIELVSIVYTFIIYLMVFAYMLMLSFNSQIKNPDKYEQKYKKREKIKKNKIYIIINKIIEVLSFIYIIIWGISTLFAVSLKNKFELCVEEIRPYITEKEYYEYKSEWIQMKTGKR